MPRPDKKTDDFLLTEKKTPLPFSAENLILSLFIISLIFFFPKQGLCQGLYIQEKLNKAGDIIESSVMMEKTENLAGLKIVMSYDPLAAEFVKCSKTRHTAPLLHVVNSKVKGRLIIVMAGARGIKGQDFPLAILNFKIKPGFEKNCKTGLKILEGQLMSDKLKEIKFSVLSARSSFLSYTDCRAQKNIVQKQSDLPKAH